MANKKKKASDSFSGIPAIVLGSNTGMIVKKKEEIKAITLALFSPTNLVKTVFTSRKKAIIVRTKKKTGKITAEYVTELVRFKKERML